MPTFWLIIILLALSVAGFLLGRRRALATADGDIRALHSLPSYYGVNVAMWAGVPSLLLLASWLLLQPMLIETRVAKSIPNSMFAEAGSLNLLMTDVRRLAEGLDLAEERGLLSNDQINALDLERSNLRAELGTIGVALGSEILPEMLAAAKSYRNSSKTGHLAMVVACLTLAGAGFVYALLQIQKDLRARNLVERGVMALLVLAASLAILTTVGIVLSMLFETVNFFGLHAWSDFFFGTTWAPNFRGDSELSILPLLWGTLYISAIALLVAVPVGLFAAIYLSEYASPAVRTLAKPLLEILAGIPTIVYGLSTLR